MMNIHPARLLVQENEELIATFESNLYGRNGVNVLAAPNKPELAELVNEEGDKSCVVWPVFTAMSWLTPPCFQHVTLAAFDQSDSILMGSP